MAIGKRRARPGTKSRRKPGASKKRKAKSVAGTAATATIGGKRFTKKSCHTTKTAAKSAAEKVRATGKTARVVKSGSAHCVFEGARRRRA